MFTYLGDRKSFAMAARHVVEAAAFMRGEERFSAGNAEVRRERRSLKGLFNG